MLKIRIPVLVSLISFVCLAAAADVFVGIVPPDAHEPVTGNVQVVADPDAHAAALYLLERARQNSVTHNRGMQPFYFKASFTASGSGAGELTETWMNGQKWRWTANMGNTSIIRISNGGPLLENGHADAVPMRAHMLRNEIFWAIDEYTAKSQIRTAQIQWNGKPATCILASGVTVTDTESRGRIWQEEEYCVDNSSGLLMIHSIAPGTFAVFGYGSQQKFHGRTLPDQITLYVAGTQVANANFSIADPGAQEQAAITPGPEMISDGRPFGMGMAGRMPMRAPADAALLPGGAPQSVMIHAQVNAVGDVTEEEVSATGSSALTQAALDLVKASNFAPTGTQRQMYLNVVFGR